MKTNEAKTTEEKLNEAIAALQQIADMRPVPGYTSPSALMLRIVAINSTARAAIAKATGE